MRKTNRCSTLTALVAAAVLTGCSDSEPRQAAQKLREAVDQARQAYAEAHTALAYPAKLSPADRERTRQEHDLVAKSVLADWMRAIKGRERLLFDDQSFNGYWARWEECREVMKDVATYRIRLEDVPRDLRARYIRSRAADLLPLAPPRVEDLSPADWESEQVKREIVERLKDEQARRQIFDVLFDELALEALGAYARQTDQNAKLLTAADDAAAALLASWTSDDAKLSAIAAAGAAGMAPEVAAKLKARLQDADARAALLRQLRQGGSVPLEPAPGPREDVLAELRQAEQALAGALAAQAAAPEPDRKTAQTMHAQLVELLGGCHAQTFGAAADEAEDAAGLAIQAAAALTGQFDVLAHHDKLLSAKAEDLPAAEQAAKQAVTDAEAKVEALTRTKAEKEKLLGARETEARDLGQQVAQGFVELKQATKYAVREKKLNEVEALQAKALAARREADELVGEIDGLALDLKLAGHDRDGSRARLALVQARMKDREGRDADINARRRQTLLDVAVTRRRLAMLTGRQAQVYAQAEKARSAAKGAFDRAGELFAAIGSERRPDEARLLLAAVDLSARRREVLDRTAGMAEAVMGVLKREEAAAAGIGAADAVAVIKPAIGVLAPQTTTRPVADTMAGAAQALAGYKARRLEQMRTDDADCAKAIEICGAGLSSPDESAAMASKDMLAAAYAARFHVSPNPQAVRRTVMGSPLADVLAAAPPQRDPMHPMYSVRRLRRLMGLKAWPDPEVPTTQP